MGVKRADRNRKIVGVTSATRQKRRVFLAKNGLVARTRFGERFGHARRDLP
jgi:hypothetical protein